ncbi:MAG: DNA mismatch repair protein MutL [Flammeovirgaceae bacterium]|jgi:DNA mismatch repair protein MutL
MQDIIHLLPESLANQIAAGEVVQRPASAVKELLENSVDAGATDIQLIVRDAGKTLIQVVDNGKGMSETDARMCFERHATSKITKTDDLFSIHTFGFRGEAMASIAAIAQVELKTKTQDDEIGTQILIEGSEVKSQEPVATANGASISVKNLFFNVPARRNFLKSNPVELKYIVEEFQRVALCNPQIAMSMYQNDTETFNLASGTLPKRIVGVFGKSYQDKILICEEEVQHIKVWGFVGKPEASKKTRGEQLFFANGRFIKHPYLHHAVMSAFEGLLQDGTFPFYLLNIELDAKHLDVNVHPTKTEVKFDDERTVYAIVRAAVKKALAKNGAMPALDFDLNVNFAQFDEVRMNKPSKPSRGGSTVSFGGDSNASSREKSNLKNWEKLYPQTIKQAETWESIASMDNSPQEKSGELTFSSAANEITDVANPFHGEEKKVVLQLRNRYILSQVKSGLMVVDQKAGMERVLFERFQQQMANSKQGASQQLLFPRTIQLSATDFALLMELKPEITALGYLFDVFGKQTIVVNGVPLSVADTDEQEMLEAFIEQLKMNKSEISLDRKNAVSKAMAKRIATQSVKPLTEQEMKTLIEQIFASSNPNYSPSGKKIIALMPMGNIEGLFEG